MNTEENVNVVEQNQTEETNGIKSEKQANVFFQSISQKQGTIIILLLIILIILSATNLYFNQKFTRWEYTIAGIEDENWDFEMNKYGANGWELVFARRATAGSYGDPLYECIFKRPKTNLTDQ